MAVLKKVTGIVAFLGLSVGCAYGADLSGGAAPSYKDAPGNYWVVTVGGYGVYEPAFPGAKDYVFSGRPIIDVHQAWRQRVADTSQRFVQPYALPDG